MLVVLSLKIKGYLQVRYVTGMRVLFFPSWKARAMKETLQEDMGVDVSITMIKRAKARVMKKIMDTQTGEYSKLFDYALEL